MNKLLKVREIITLKEWIDGSGYNCTETYSNDIVNTIDIPKTAEDYYWNWFEIPEENPEEYGKDTKITIEFYALDAEPGYDEPITSFSKWVSELWKERNA